MDKLIRNLCTPLSLKRCTLPHRVLRSATYEGMADAQGHPGEELSALYLQLLQAMPGTLITGFCAISQAGRAMHPRQAGIWNDQHIKSWQMVLKQVRDASSEQGCTSKLFMQLAHTGRQTRAERTGREVVGASARRCSYFRQRVRALQAHEIEAIINEFAGAAYRAQQAGFDGVQLHAAHGYLLHQFLSVRTNTRQDQWRDGARLFSAVVRAVRSRCGAAFPILVKVSYSDDFGLSPQVVLRALLTVAEDLDAVEVSYGSMENPLNIIRGACPLAALLTVNPLFNRSPRFLRYLWQLCYYPFKRRQFKPYGPCYNAEGALTLQQGLQQALPPEQALPVIPVGGINSLEDMALCLQQNFAAVALCRPFICEPDLMPRLQAGVWQRSLCSRCNLCTVYCDSHQALHCYQRRS